MCHSVPRKLSMSFLRWQNSLHKALAIGAHSLSRSCTLSQVGLSSKQKFISQLGGKKHFALQTALMSQVTILVTHTKEKKNFPLQSIVSQLQHLKGRLPFPLAKTYEHKKMLEP